MPGEADDALDDDESDSRKTFEEGDLAPASLVDPASRV